MKKIVDLPAQWTAGLHDERIKFLLQAAWVRLPAHERAVLPALVHEITDSADAPNADSIGGVGDLRIKGNTATVKVWLTGTKAIQNPNACTWVMVHELAHVVKRDQLLPVIVAALRLTTKDTPYNQADEKLLDILCEDAADLLAACVWGFLPEFRAFLVEFPHAYRPRWLADGVLDAAVAERTDPR
jgi:hypothetical protein